MAMYYPRYKCNNVELKFHPWFQFHYIFCLQMFETNQTKDKLKLQHIFLHLMALENNVA